MHRARIHREGSRFAGAGAEVAAGLTDRAFFTLDAAAATGCSTGDPDALWRHPGGR